MLSLDLAYRNWLNGVPVHMLPHYHRELREEIDRLREESRAPRRRVRNRHSAVGPRVLKTRDAAVYLGVSAWKLRSLVQSGEISYISGDGTSPWLFDKVELDSWIESRKVKL
jgi:excisionase family DNA binding protein